MDEENYKQTVKRLQQVNTVIAKLDPAVREQAFAMLSPYVTGPERGPSGEALGGGASPGQPLDADGLLGQFASDKAADNAVLCAAVLYGEYGTSPFQVSEIKGLADRAGLTVPARIDRTFDSAKREGKALLRKTSNRKWAPTVAGESYFKSTYGVSKGRKEKPEPEK